MLPTTALNYSQQSNYFCPVSVVKVLHVLENSVVTESFLAKSASTWSEQKEVTHMLIGIWNKGLKSNHKVAWDTCGDELHARQTSCDLELKIWIMSGPTFSLGLMMRFVKDMNTNAESSEGFKRKMVYCECRGSRAEQSFFFTCTR